MKKLGVILAMMLLLCSVSGCEKSAESSTTNGTLTCTKSDVDDEGYKEESTLEVTYKDNKVTVVKETNVTEMDADSVDMALAFSELFLDAFNDIEGMDVQYSKVNDTSIKYVMTVDYTKIDVDKVKEYFDEDTLDEDALLSAKDMTIDEFKEKNLEGYTCK